MKTKYKTLFLGHLSNKFSFYCIFLPDIINEESLEIAAQLTYLVWHSMVAIQSPPLSHILTDLSKLEDTKWFPLLLYLMHVIDDVCPSKMSNNSRDTSCLVLLLCFRTDFDVIDHSLISLELPLVASLYWRTRGFSSVKI